MPRQGAPETRGMAALKTADLPRIGESIRFAGDHAFLAVPSVNAEIAPGTHPRPLARRDLESLPGGQYD